MILIIKKVELSDNINKFPPVSYPIIIVTHFLFSLSPLTKVELKAYKKRTRVWRPTTSSCQDGPTK